MNDLEILLSLNQMLLSDMPQYRRQAANFSMDALSQWQLFRSLVNVRLPGPISKEFLSLQDSFLQKMIEKKGITDLSSLTPIQKNLYLWQGDITTLRVDGIVNAANSGLTGCYYPCHSCIDNAIHTFSGVQLRLECANIMEKQGYPEPVGQAKITNSYNLPCQYILHTVGPMINISPSEKDCQQLVSCYQSCLKLAEQNHLTSIAFCCISTGEFHFPSQKAAEIAIKTVCKHLKDHKNMKIIFNVFSSKEYQIYRNLLDSLL